MRLCHEIAWQVGSIATGVGGAATGGVALAKAGIKVGGAQLEKMAELARIEKVAKVAKADVPPTPPSATTGKIAADQAGQDKIAGGAAANTVERLEELKLDGFNPYDNPRYKALSPDKKKAFLQEYNKQLQAQQDAINSMTAEEFRIARDLYIQNGRNPISESMQKDLGRRFELEVAENIRESLISKNISPSEATKIAKARAKEIKSNLAALHEPDMVAGGYNAPDPIRMGDTNVNSSIGGSWPSRIPTIDNAVNTAIANGNGNARLNVRLELLRGAQK